jgi:hypothetical protein
MEEIKSTLKVNLPFLSKLLNMNLNLVFSARYALELNGIARAGTHSHCDIDK